MIDHNDRAYILLGRCCRFMSREEMENLTCHPISNANLLAWYVEYLINHYNRVHPVNDSNDIRISRELCRLKIPHNVNFEDGKLVNNIDLYEI